VLPVLAAYKVQQVKLDLGVGAPAGGWSPEATAVAWADIDEWGSTQIADTIKELRGFYVKTGQVQAAATGSLFWAMSPLSLAAAA
jgi:hypothetical protein